MQPLGFGKGGGETTGRVMVSDHGGTKGAHLTTVACVSDSAHLVVRASVLTGHQITSSAKTRSVGGNVIPSAWAVLRLRTNSNFVGCSTGRSAGLAPFRMRSTYEFAQFLAVCRSCRWNPWAREGLDAARVCAGNTPCHGAERRRA